MKIRIKKLHEDAIIPKYQTNGASGFDLHALEDVEINYGETKLVKTGLAFSVGRRALSPLPGIFMDASPFQGKNREITKKGDSCFLVRRF